MQNSYQSCQGFWVESKFSISGDTNSVVVATYKSLTPGSVNDFRFSLVKELGHQYPNGDNHWMEGARAQWAWFKQYSLPSDFTNAFMKNYYFRNYFLLVD